jgi:hypothetical protein
MTCTHTERAVFSFRSLGGDPTGKKSISRHALFVEQPNNAKTPRLAGSCLRLEGPLLSHLVNPTIAQPPLGVKQNRAVVGMSYGPGRGTCRKLISK